MGRVFRRPGLKVSGAFLVIVGARQTVRAQWELISTAKGPAL